MVKSINEEIDEREQEAQEAREAREANQRARELQTAQQVGGLALTGTGLASQLPHAISGVQNLYQRGRGLVSLAARSKYSKHALGGAAALGLGAMAMKKYRERQRKKEAQSQDQVQPQV